MPADVLVYGRNGVMRRAALGPERELGLIVETTAATKEAAETLASLLTHYLVHFGYVGRKATAGNIGYPLSPNLMSFRRADGQWGAIVPSGTRDPVFFENYAKVKQGVIDSIAAGFPQALAQAKAHHRGRRAASGHPAAHHRRRPGPAGGPACAGDRRYYRQRLMPKPDSILDIDAADAYEWSLYHLLQNVELIQGIAVSGHPVRRRRVG
ncbi:MAG: hypothetical protein R3E52_15605 [Burkholderiaceae bacterium]